MNIDLGKGLVMFPLAEFDAMRESAKKGAEELKAEKLKTIQTRQAVEEAARQLEILLSYLRGLVPREFQQSVDQFNAQSEEAEIILRPDGKVKIQILSKKGSSEEESSDS